MICLSNTCGQDSRNCKTPWTCGSYENEAHYNAMHAPIKRDEITFIGPEPLEPLELAARVERIALRVLLVIALIAAAALWLYGPGWAQWLTWIAP